MLTMTVKESDLLCYFQPTQLTEQWCGVVVLQLTKVTVNPPTPSHRLSLSLQQ